MKKKFKVQVTITGDEDVKASIAQLLQAEVATLTDVELVTEKPDWMLEVLGIAPRNEKQEPVVFLLSVLVTQPSSFLLSAKKDLVRKHAFYLKGGHDLRVLAKEIVASFDKDQLASHRKK